MLSQSSVSPEITSLDYDQLNALADLVTGGHSTPTIYGIIILVVNQPAPEIMDRISTLRDSAVFQSAPIIVMAGPAVGDSFIRHCYLNGVNAVLRLESSLRSLQRKIDVLAVFWLRDTLLPADVS